MAMAMAMVATGATTSPFPPPSASLPKTTPKSLSAYGARITPAGSCGCGARPGTRRSRAARPALNAHARGD